MFFNFEKIYKLPNKNSTNYRIHLKIDKTTWKTNKYLLKFKYKKYIIIRK